MLIHAKGSIVLMSVHLRNVGLGAWTEHGGTSSLNVQLVLCQVNLRGAIYRHRCLVASSAEMRLRAWIGPEIIYLVCRASVTFVRKGVLVRAEAVLSRRKTLSTSVVGLVIELQLLSWRKTCAVGHVGRCAAYHAVALMACGEVVLYD
jgi:hypothetical protein